MTIICKGNNSELSLQSFMSVKQFNNTLQHTTTCGLPRSNISSSHC